MGRSHRQLCTESLRFNLTQRLLGKTDETEGAGPVGQRGRNAGNTMGLKYAGHAPPREKIHYFTGVHDIPNVGIFLAYAGSKGYIYVSAIRCSRPMPTLSLL